MTTKTIDHSTLSRLAEAGSVKAARVIAQAGGWVLYIKYGIIEQSLATGRSGKLRLFRKLETVMFYLKKLGISNFHVDITLYDKEEAKKLHKRPDRAKALKNLHQAALHDNWFREQVEKAVQDADKPDTIFIPHETVMDNLVARLDKIADQQ